MIGGFLLSFRIRGPGDQDLVLARAVGIAPGQGDGVDHAHAVDEGIIPANPANRLGGFRKETSSKANAMKVVPYTTKEVQKLLVKARDGDFQLYSFVLTAVLTGMRLGELIGLHWDDIDSQSECIHVKRAVSRRRLETPKSHLQRRIDLPDELGRVLEELKRRKREECFGKGERLPKWVFSNEAGDRRSRFVRTSMAQAQPSIEKILELPFS